ncbi:MAG: CpaF family protein [Thermoleophilaceae bacterium]|nr:CpaF family protein [Thermoleophilaceae bacterium]
MTATQSLLRADGSPAALDLQLQAAELVARAVPLLAPGTRELLVDRIVELSTGLGPLEALLADPTVDEVMVNGLRPVWVERAGALHETNVQIGSDRELANLVERILAPVGRRVDEASPVCDARLPDGSRVNVVVAPLALDGTVLTIRRFRHRALDAQALIGNGTLSRRTLDFLAGQVHGRASLLVSGSTGSGKTTTLNVLSSFVPASERIVTIEDAAELRLRQGHVVRLEARPAGADGRGAVTIRMLVRNALRMRPDRIVVGEVRGGEALDMLAAMTTGHDGSLTTVHASSALGALRRIETLALMAGVDLPHRAIRAQVAEAFDFVVHQRRMKDGSRRVVEIAKVEPCDEGYVLLPMMTFDGSGVENWQSDQSLSSQPHNATRSSATGVQ